MGSNENTKQKLKRKRNVFDVVDGFLLAYEELVRGRRDNVGLTMVQVVLLKVLVMTAIAEMIFFCQSSLCECVADVFV